MEIDHYTRPATVDEACTLHQEYGEQAAFLAGGTDLLVQARSGLRPVRYAIDISELEELTGVVVGNGGLSVGAGVKWSTLVSASEVNSQAPLLAEAARTLGSVQVRNMATLGGNICNASPAADLVVALLALDARVVIARQSDTRTMPLAEFFLDAKRTSLGHGELLREVYVPQHPKQTAFLKLGRVTSDIALVCVAVALEADDGDRRCGDVRIALGAVGPTAKRAEKAEALLRGQPRDEALIEEAAAVAGAETNCIDDVRASAAYRRELTRVLVARALTRVWGSSEESDANRSESR